MILGDMVGEAERDLLQAFLLYLIKCSRLGCRITFSSPPKSIRTLQANSDPSDNLSVQGNVGVLSIDLC